VILREARRIICWRNSGIAVRCSIAILFCCRSQATLKISTFLNSGKFKAAPLRQHPYKEGNVGTVIVDPHLPTVCLCCSGLKDHLRIENYWGSECFLKHWPLCP